MPGGDTGELRNETEMCDWDSKCGDFFNTETQTRNNLYPNDIGNEHFSLIESHKNNNSAYIRHLFQICNIFTILSPF